MRKALTRFYEWVVHPSVRRVKIENPKVNCHIYTYPSHGNENKYEIPADYKTPFSQSDYNVRYAHPTDKQLEIPSQQVSVASSLIDPIKKLIALKFLKASDSNNEMAIAEAKEKFTAAYKIDIKDSFYKNEIGFDHPDLTDRESVQKYYAKVFSKQVSSPYNFSTSEADSLNNPDIIVYESLDFYDEPELQQFRVEGEYFESELKNRKLKLAEEGRFIVKQSSENFWKSLDDSNDPENVRKVQEKVGDSNPLDFALKNNKITYSFDKNGNVIDIQQISQ